MHPLMNNPRWRFNQPAVGFRSHYVAVALESNDPSREVITIEIGDSCREVTIYSTRETFKTRLTNWLEVRAAAKGSWSVKKPHVALRTVDLTDSTGKEEPTTLKILWHKSYMKDWEDFAIEDFLKVCNVVLGPVAVLLGPWRPQGSWWKTDPSNCVWVQGGQQYIHWKGSDNWFLAHPAMMAIATGLYRQCFHLCGTGVANEIIDSVSEGMLEETMSTNNPRLALQIIKETRPWIEVPVADPGARMNYAFPLGTWRRLIRLQRAIRRHGYEKGLGQSFHEGWGTLSDTYHKGLHSFWGMEGELSEHHKYLMKVGAPRRKNSVKNSA